MLFGKMLPVSLLVLASMAINCGKKDSKKNNTPQTFTFHLSFDKFVTGCTEQVIDEAGFEMVKNDPEFADYGVAKGSCPEKSAEGKPILGGCKHPDDTINWHYESLLFADVEEVKQTCERTTVEDDNGNDVQLVFIERK